MSDTGVVSPTLPDHRRPLVDLAAMRPDALAEQLARVGGTPLVPIPVDGNPISRIYAKIEAANPGGSIKDRPALSIIENLERDGRISEGDLIVDSTSGNFGVSMAWICRAKGYRFCAVIDPGATIANITRMRALGADVDLVSERDETGGYLLTRIRRAQEIVSTGRARVCSDQYTNPANPQSHARTTGPEMVRAFDDPPDFVVVSASTGGTLAGVAECVRRNWPDTVMVAVDGQGSSMFGGAAGHRVINGLGASQNSRFLTPEHYDRVVRVSPREAIVRCHQLRRRGIVDVGGSSGAAIVAAETVLSAATQATSALVICPDHGQLYEESIYSAQWCAANGIALPP